MADLELIGEFIARERPKAAASTVDRILDSAAALAQHPELGRRGRVEGTRELVVNGTPFIVPYRIKDRSIEILAVFHAARRWPEQF